MYNVHVWSSCEKAALRTLNAVHMRAVRRAVGQVADGRGSVLSDPATRKAFGVLALETQIRKKRLKYLSR
eukprot:12192043-Alexandrium_andersonii.AAC.1